MIHKVSHFADDSNERVLPAFFISIPGQKPVFIRFEYTELD